MANFCSNCGHELRDSDKFCAECGTPTDARAVPAPPLPPPAYAPGPPTYVPARAVAYETCEIKWRTTMRWPIYKFVFYGEAIGPRGVYAIGQSRAVTNVKSPVSFGASMQKLQPYVQNLIAQLTATGWEPVPDRGLRGGAIGSADL